MEAEKFFKDWLKEDEICPLCNHVTHQKKGITRQNMKKMLRWSWSTNDLILLFVIAMLLFVSWRYTVETKECRAYVQDLRTNPYDTCAKLTSNATNAAKGIESLNNLNLSIWQQQNTNSSI